MWVAAFAALALSGRVVAATTPARAVEFRFTPAARAQIALWVEKPDGTFLATVRLTQAVALYGIGNRPGASQMNSGFRWPYGRRLDVLPVWAHRRAAAPGAAQFKQVIYQHRTSEGCASNAGCGGSDSSADAYFCLSFMQETTRKAALDAVSCATPFSSDKGRFLTATDVAGGYSEPVESAGVGMLRPLELDALYPPRRDGAGCAGAPACIDHADVATYSGHVRDVMPDIDTVTMATPPGEREQSVLFTVPDTWPDGDYVAWIEVNVEGDNNAVFSQVAYPTPQLPTGAWDSWAIDFGYPYRGQPSVLYSVPFSVTTSGTFASSAPAGYGDVNGFGPAGGRMNPMDGTITDDPTSASAAGSGADRLRLIAPNDYRVQVNVRDRQYCQDGQPPQIPVNLVASRYDDPKHTHEWGHLEFGIPASDRTIDHYEVRYSQANVDPITAADPSSFMRALPAVAASRESEALAVPTGGMPGQTIAVDFGGMEALTAYTVAVRAVDTCNAPGPFQVAALTTTRVQFTKLSGCFIATAAYGSAMDPQVQALRTVRDALRPRSALFAMATELYYRAGPAAAAVIARSAAARAVVRTLIAPAVDVSRLAAPLLGAVRR